MAGELNWCDALGGKTDFNGCFEGKHEFLKDVSEVFFHGPASEFKRVQKLDLAILKVGPSFVLIFIKFWCNSENIHEPDTL